MRYFDREARRPGLPRDVGALVERITPDGVTLTLVNTNTVKSTKLVVQTGAYAEHDAVSVTLYGETVNVGDSHFAVDLAAGSGAQMTIRMKRYVNQPTFAFPWDR